MADRAIHHRSALRQVGRPSVKVKTRGQKAIRGLAYHPWVASS